MLSKEEIETCKKEAENHINFMTISGDNAGWAKGLLWYIEQLEKEKQNLIEILEEELTVDNLTVKANKIEKILYGDRISIIKEQAIRATNAYRKQILEILKGEKNE